MANTLKLPVGIENFEEIRKLGFYYIDKTRLRTAFTGMGKGDSFYTSKAFWKDTQYEYA